VKLNEFVEQRRREAGLTQPQKAYHAGIVLRFVKELEQGKENLRMDKVNLLLWLWDHQVGTVPASR
jgi:predicted transcriptional regulator